MIELYNKVLWKIKDAENQIKQRLTGGEKTGALPGIFNYKIVFLDIKLFVLDLFANFMKFLIVLFKDSAFSFNTLFQKDADGICRYSYLQFKVVQKQVRVFSTAGAMAVVTISIVVVLILNLLTGVLRYAAAATYTWSQTNWSSLTANTTGHPAPENWTEFTASTTALITGASLSITATASSTTQTDNGVTNTGFNLTTPTFSKTEVMLSGADAKVVLTEDETPFSDMSIVDGGYAHACIVTNSDNAYCWGENTAGKLGDGSSTTRLTPVRVVKGQATGADTDGTYLINMAMVSPSRYYTCAVSNAGNAYCWGSGTDGRLGNGGTTSSNTPVRVLKGEATGADTDGTYLTNIASIIAGPDHACAVSNAGNAYCWGTGGSGRLGNGGTTSSYTPVRVVKGQATGADTDGTYLTNIKEMNAAYYHTCAVSNAGYAYCWGEGWLGWGSDAGSYTPVHVQDGQATGADTDGTYLTNIETITGDHSAYTCASSGSGYVYCWGYGAGGLLGDGYASNRNTPVKVVKGQATGADTDGTYLTNIASVSVQEAHACVISNSGYMYCWGYNDQGEFGIGSLSSSYTPVKVLGGEAWGDDSDGTYLKNVAEIATMQNGSCATTQAHRLYCWGNGTYIANASVTNYYTPVQAHGVGDVGFFNLDDAPVVYNSSGTYTSSSIDISTSVTWGNLSWTNSAGQTITIKARSDADGDFSDATAWGSCANITSGQALSTGGCVTNGHRYIQYQATLSTADTSVTPTLNDITLGYSYYLGGQYLVSSAFDSGDDTSLMGQVFWTEDTTLPLGSYFSLSLRATSSSALLGTTNWTELTSTSTGCSKSSGVVTCLSTALPLTMRDGAGDRWFQYKVTLSSTGGTTPTVTDVSVQYVVNAPPELQNVTAVQQSDGTVLITYEVRDTDTTFGTAQAGYITPSFSYSINGGSTFNNITTGLSSGATSSKAVDETDWTEYTATWTAKDQIDGTYTSAFQIYIQADDGEGANRYATTTTSSVALDVKDPILGSPSVYVRATSTPATLVLNASDDSALQMKIGLVSDLSGASWESYAANSTVSLATDPDTVYIQFKDAFSNTSTIQSATTPTTPSTGFMIQDTSNTDTSEWRLFIAWGVSDLSAEDFGSYQIYRSVDGGSTYAYRGTAGSGDKTTNYYNDTGLTQNSTYYYKVAQVDSLGNTSYLSTSIQAIVNGVEDAGEGGGGTPASAPAISSVSSNGETTQTSTITWTTDKLSNSTVGYCVAPCSDYTTEQGVASYVTSHSVTLTGLTPGTDYNYKVISADVYGNTASSTGYTTTTNAGPTISGVSVVDVANTSAQITWNTDTAASGYVIYSTSTPPSGNEAGWGTRNTSRTVTLTGLSPGTKYYFYVRSQDVDTNWAYDYNTVSGMNDYYTFTTSSDSDAPTITSVAASSIRDTSAVITWSTNEGATSQVEYGTSSGTYTASSTLKTELDTSHFVSLTGLTQGIAYYYRVISADANGLTSTSTEETFTALETQIGISQQTVTVVVSGGGGGGFSGVTQTEHDKVKKELSSTKKELNEIKDKILGVNIDDTLDPKEIIKIVIEKFVSIAQRYRKDPTLELTGDDLAPAIESLRELAELVPPPSLKGNPLVEANSTDADIFWETDKETNSVIAYAAEDEYKPDTDKPYTAETGDYDNYSAAHKVTLTNLKPGTNYNFQIRSKGQAGELIKTRNYTFTTTTQMPKISNARLNRIDDYSVSVSWKTSVPSDSVVIYAPLVGGKVSDEDTTTFGKQEYATEHALKLKDLDPATTYSLEVSSTDAFGNTVKEKMPFFSTVKDVTPPDITQVRTELTVFPGSLNKIQAIVFWKTDEPGTSQVFYEQGIREISAGETLQKTTLADDELTVSHMVVLTDWQPNAVYRFRVSSKDQSGNEGYSKDFTVLTPKKKATVVDLILDNFAKTFGWTKELGL